MNRESLTGRSGPEKSKWRGLGVLLSALGFFGALMLSLLFIPAQTAQETTPAPDIPQRFSQHTAEMLDGVMENYTYIPKRYRIPYGSLPVKGDEAAFGESSDPQVIEAVIARAADLLDGERVTAWTPETQLRPGTGVSYYYDETILVLSWQELSEGRVCTWCEVKVADVSQVRRKLSGDRYGSPIQLPASVLAAQDNAVAAISGDFYAFRSAGVHVYGGALYHESGEMADTCFVDRDGNLLIVHQYEIRTWAQANAYVRENNILFSLAFGPSIVENGQIRIPAEYPWGENYESYARAVLSQVGHLHYVFLAANRGDLSLERFVTAEVAQMMLDHGCTMAYCLDGGQTAELIFHDRVMNEPEFNVERQVSDVVCFASALPEGGAS